MTKGSNGHSYGEESPGADTLYFVAGRFVLWKNASIILAPMHAEVWNYRTVVNFPYKIFSYARPTIAVQEILNMFILRPPPENPSGIRQECLADRFVSRTDRRTPQLCRGGWIQAERYIFLHQPDSGRNC